MLDNQAILVGSCALGFFMLWLTVFSVPSRPPCTVISKSNPFHVYWDILYAFDPEPVGFWWAAGSALWGSFVSTNWGSTTAFPFGFPDNAAGLIIGVLGWVMLLAIGFNKHRTYAFAVLGLAFAWGFVGWSAGATSGWHSSAWLVYIGASVVAGWIWVRLQWDDTRLTAVTL